VKRSFAIIAGFLLFQLGCGLSQKSLEPSIEFSVIPSAEIGGTMRLEIIEGHVFNARPDQQIVLYTRSGDWYVQPFANQNFTKIEADSSWRNSTHLGTEYAALLVEPNYKPPAKISVLPNKDGAGVLAVAIVNGTPLFWQSWWFRSLAVLVCVFLLFAYFRSRMHRLTNEMNVRFEERLAERTRIAQELHDSLLQGFVGVSMQIAVAVEQLPADSPAKPQLKRVVKTIGKVIEEGRHTVQGLRSSSSNDFTNLERQFSELRQDLDTDGQTDFRILVEGLPKPLCPPVADEIYHICREALFNAFRHAKARQIEVEIEYAMREFRIAVRDDGIGIDPQIIESGRENHWGLSGMRERAEKIGALLKVLSRTGAGTEIELSVPNKIAFETGESNGSFKWLAKLDPRKLKSGKEPNK
jgi:signal transduction histidine kinase